MLTVKYLLAPYYELIMLDAVRRSGKTCAVSTRLKSCVDLDHLAMDSYTGTSFHFYGFYYVFYYFFIIVIVRCNLTNNIEWP